MELHTRMLSYTLTSEEQVAYTMWLRRHIATDLYLRQRVEEIGSLARRE